MLSAADVKAGPIVERRLYTDVDVLGDEQRLIFERSWLFVAHESEIKNPGDFKTTDMAGQPVLAIRGDDGEIRVFLNTCRHRGAIVETEPGGCKKRFRCLYHHWEYNASGELAFVPREEGFGPGFKRSDFGLKPVARTAIFHGLVFASLSRDVPDLASYLGDATPYVTEIATYEGRAMEAVGSFEYTYDGNWKLLYENTLDDYHNEYLHGHVYRNAPGFRYGSDYLGAKKGRTASSVAPPPTHLASTLGLHSLIEWNDSPDKMPLQNRRTHRVNIAVFPSFLGIYHPVLDMTGLRILKPERPDRTRVLNYLLVPADLSAQEKKAVASRFNAAWGPGGRIMMDDIRVLALVQQGLKAKNGGDILITRGVHRTGTSGIDADDHSIRGFWDAWRHYMFPHSGS